MTDYRRMVRNIKCVVHMYYRVVYEGEVSPPPICSLSLGGSIGYPVLLGFKLRTVTASPLFDGPQYPLSLVPLLKTRVPHRIGSNSRFSQDRDKQQSRSYARQAGQTMKALTADGLGADNKYQISWERTRRWTSVEWECCGVQREFSFCAERMCRYGNFLSAQSRFFAGYPWAATKGINS